MSETLTLAIRAGPLDDEARDLLLESGRVVSSYFAPSVGEEVTPRCPFGDVHDIQAF